MGKDGLFHRCAGSTDYPYENYLLLCTKINSRWNKDLYLKNVYFVFVQPRDKSISNQDFKPRDWSKRCS